MEKIKIRMIEQLNNVVVQAEKIVTMESFSDVSCFDLINEETRKLTEITNEFRRIVFPDSGDIKNNISNLKNTLLQLQQKVAVDKVADEPIAVPKIEHPVLDFTADEMQVVTDASVVAEAPAEIEILVAVEPAVTEETSAVAEEMPVVAETSIAVELAVTEETSAVAEETPVVAETSVAVESAVAEETPTVVETPHLLDRLRLLNEEGKSENTSTLRAMVDKLRTTPSMPEVHLEHPVDLRTSIGINEKFLFVNELFGGSIRECNEAISFLNSLDDLESAITQIHIYKEKFGWDEESIAYMTLEEVINQRFSQLVLA
jgi:hypothetical protein